MSALSSGVHHASTPIFSYQVTLYVQADPAFCLGKLEKINQGIAKSLYAVVLL
jgi:hypothetical protein